MQVATTGLVLRQVKVGEADRILTILTPDLGVVSASARGSLRMKSALFSATRSEERRVGKECRSRWSPYH